jgi:host factor-I protein
MSKVQDAYLNIARREKVNVSIVLLHGETVQGRIKSFDRTSVLLHSENGDVLVLKHAIAKVSYKRKKAEAATEEKQASSQEAEKKPS